MIGGDCLRGNDRTRPPDARRNLRAPFVFFVLQLNSDDRRGRANRSFRVSSRPVNELKVGWADLHIHTTLSDGAATPAQVAHVLARSDLAVAAVTDHDTVEGAL